MSRISSIRRLNVDDRRRTVRHTEQREQGQRRAALRLAEQSHQHGGDGQRAKLPCVLFTNRDGQRKAVYLGAMPKKQAEVVCTKIEALNAAKVAGVAPADEVSRWTVGIGDDLHEKLAKQELVAPRQPVNLSRTLEDWLTKYIDQRRSELKAGSIERLERTAGRLKSFFGGQTRLSELTPAGAADWRAAMLAEKQPHKRGEVPKPRLTETTVRNYYRDAKTIFNAVVDREPITRNPFRKLKSSVLAANRDRYVTPEEAGTILGGCHAPQWRVLFGLARFAGLRTPSETHRLTWADVDWERKRLTVYAPRRTRPASFPSRRTCFPCCKSPSTPLPLFRHSTNGREQH